uniref:ZAD domain-containing protein n=1 Tax=Amphimedon queenslandica TaxID=400682 RepID=A0A1X7TE38_AMPQE
MSTNVICYGCGKDLSNQATNRYNLLSDSCSKALPVWKKLVKKRFLEIGIKVKVDQLLSDESGFHGRMCRICVAALYRYEKLEQRYYRKHY